MSYDDKYDEGWNAAYDDYIEQSIREIQDDRIRYYLGVYGDAVQKRVDRCLTESQKLLTSGFPSQTVISSVTATEIILRYLILRPILEGAFMSDEWTAIIVQRILNRRAASDREILPSILRVWQIDLGSILLPNGDPLWDRFTSHVVPLRNEIVHRGATATEEQGREALACPTVLIETVIRPLSDRFGFSWSETRSWHEIQQGISGARHSTQYYPASPFED
jgi:hypothetical protein